MERSYQEKVYLKKCHIESFQKAKTTYALYKKDRKNISDRNLLFAKDKLLWNTIKSFFLKWFNYTLL